MNLLNNNNNLFCSIFVHVKCLIVIHNNQNILYDFNEYEMLLDFIEKNLGIKERKNVLDYLIVNSSIVESLENNKKIKKSKNKKNKVNNPDQISLF